MARRKSTLTRQHITADYWSMITWTVHPQAKRANAKYGLYVDEAAMLAGAHALMTKPVNIKNVDATKLSVEALIELFDAAISANDGELSGSTSIAE